MYVRSGDDSPAPASSITSLTPGLAREAMWHCSSSLSVKHLLAEDRTIKPADPRDKVSDVLQQAWCKLEPWCMKYARTVMVHRKLTSIVLNAAAVPPTQVDTTDSLSDCGTWYRVSLRDKYVKLIRSGAKTVEGRLAHGEMLKIRSDVYRHEDNMWY